MFNEVKADKHTITQDDIDQAISYARLVHPIAHFCMVTNGKEQQCFHPITKEPVPEENFPFLNFKGHQSDSNAYFEALEHFMGYSEENLLNFCKQQHIEYMKQLKESKERPALAFIPELYQPSNKLSEAFSKFLQSDSKLFAVIADSGKGKTNWICHEATKFLEEKHAVLFYRCQNIQKGLFKALIDDLAWELSPDYSEAQGAKTLFQGVKR